MRLVFAKILLIHYRLRKNVDVNPLKIKLKYGTFELDAIVDTNLENSISMHELVKLQAPSSIQPKSDKISFIYKSLLDVVGTIKLDLVMNGRTLTILFLITMYEMFNIYLGRLALDLIHSSWRDTLLTHIEVNTFKVSNELPVQVNDIISPVHTMIQEYNNQWSQMQNKIQIWNDSILDKLSYIQRSIQVKKHMSKELQSSIDMAECVI